MRLIVLSLTFLFFFCQKPSNLEFSSSENNDSLLKVQEKAIIPGAYNFSEYLPLLKKKSVALVVNQTSLVGETHLVDTLLRQDVNVVKVFAPEHGFRGTVSAGEHIKSSIDNKTGLPIVSLYGSNKKPTAEQLKDVDVIIFDIQDVGVRFYTYISTMHYLMEASAENNKKIIVLDRPNPHGMHIDGPILEDKHKSFVGMHPIPLVHGLTVGELAMMINGEQWINGQADLTVVKMQNYDHSKTYSLPVKPSPNLPNDLSITLYPSLGLLEGTVISVGRGTEAPFQQIGHPLLTQFEYKFMPQENEGAINPPYEGEEVFGISFQERDPEYGFTLSHIIDMYQAFPEKEKFFNNFFEKLAGNSDLRGMIMSSVTEEKIKESWKPELEEYKVKRKQYLLYPDFE